MIYHFPATDEPVDQADIIDGCPIIQIAHFDPQAATSPLSSAQQVELWC